ncbi:MAG: helix-turn-helix transcriptional regulator [Halolamina sp.]
MESNEERPADGSDPASPEPSMTETLETVGAIEPAALDAELGVTAGECMVLLVGEHGGRLPQEDLVSLVPWSAATVSRLLSRLEDDQQVVRIPSGRGNVVLLPEETPDRMLSDEG